MTTRMEQAVAREAARAAQSPGSAVMALSAETLEQTHRIAERAARHLAETTDLHLTALRGEVQWLLAEIDRELALRISRQMDEEGKAL
jgi:hypothetical protein